MYSSKARADALALLQRGLSLRAVSIFTRVSRATLREWRDHPGSDDGRARCPRCAESPRLPEPSADYAYLLGLYLGDGCVSVGGAPAKGVWKLRVICCDAWPGVMEECCQAIQAVRPGNKVVMVRKQGCTEVLSYSRHWPCLFPQHASRSRGGRPWRGLTSSSGRSTDRLTGAGRARGG